MNLTLVFGVLKAGFELWNTKEGNKYRDQVTKLEKEYHNELDKRSLGKRYSQLKLDRIMRDIDTLAKNFIQYAPKK
jgi:hypothetical protein